jgi:TonB family protein
MPRVATFVFVAAVLLSLTGFIMAQHDPAADGPTTRKVTLRVAPDYPELAKRMHLEGSVKIEAVVRPNGSVKSTRVIGGNPVLVQAAADAVTKWKFETGPSETTEVVQLSFVAR